MGTTQKGLKKVVAQTSNQTQAKSTKERMIELSMESAVAHSWELVEYFEKKYECGRNQRALGYNELSIRGFNQDTWLFERMYPEITQKIKERARKNILYSGIISEVVQDKENHKYTININQIGGGMVSISFSEQVAMQKNYTPQVGDRVTYLESRYFKNRRAFLLRKDGQDVEIFNTFSCSKKIDGAVIAHGIFEDLIARGAYGERR